MTDFGNLRTKKSEPMHVEDIYKAAEDVYGTDTPVPEGLNVSEIQQAVMDLLEANAQADRLAGPAAMLAWGIMIGINAEKTRTQRMLQRVRDEML